MLSFIDIAGYSKDRFFLLATRGQPGEWSGVFCYDEGSWSLLREFPNEWIVSIDVFDRSGLVMASDSGLIYRWIDNCWERYDSLAIHGLTNIRSFGIDATYVCGSRGFFAHVSEAGVIRIPFDSRRRIMSIGGTREDDLILVGDKGLFARIVDDQIVKEDPCTSEMLCDVAEDDAGNILAVGSNGVIIGKRDSEWVAINAGVSWRFTEVCVVENDVFLAIGGGIIKVDNGIPNVEFEWNSSDAFLCAIAQFSDGSTIAVGEPEMVLLGPKWRNMSFDWDKK